VEGERAEWLPRRSGTAMGSSAGTSKMPRCARPEMPTTATAEILSPAETHTRPDSGRLHLGCQDRPSGMRMPGVSHRSSSPGTQLRRLSRARSPLEAWICRSVSKSSSRARRRRLWALLYLLRTASVGPPGRGWTELGRDGERSQMSFPRGAMADLGRRGRGRAPAFTWACVMPCRTPYLQSPRARTLPRPTSNHPFPW
jgi:hypothetical protein